MYLLIFSERFTAVKTIDYRAFELKICTVCPQEAASKNVWFPGLILKIWKCICQSKLFDAAIYLFAIALLPHNFSEFELADAKNSNSKSAEVKLRLTLFKEEFKEDVLAR